MERRALNHLNRATFILEDQLWPTAPWADSWRDDATRWRYTQLAYLIAHIKVKGRKCHTRALNHHIPSYVIAEVMRRYEDLADLDICPICTLPLIDSFCNKHVHA